MSVSGMRKLMEAIAPRKVEAEEPPYGDPRFSHGADDTGAAYNNQSDEEPYDIGDTFDWQEEMESGIVISDNTRGGYNLSADGKFLGNFAEWDNVMEEAKQWMNKHKYWPNMFFVNDHGNVTHIDFEGKEINSIVETNNKLTSQDQRSTYDQLVTLLQLANKNGLYDAADWLKNNIKTQFKKQTTVTEEITGLDNFTKAYIEAALWSSTDNSDESGGEPLDRNYSPDDISDETMKEIINDCKSFQEQAGDMINAETTSYVPSDELAGHDFWLTRNGHGSGFWDGDWPEPEATKLSDLSRKFGEYDLYVGDDGSIYGS